MSNIQPLVDRCSGSQPQVVENLNKFTQQDNGWYKHIYLDFQVQRISEDYG